MIDASRPKVQLLDLVSRCYTDKEILLRELVFNASATGAVVRLVHWRDNNPVVWRRR